MFKLLNGTSNDPEDGCTPLPETHEMLSDMLYGRVPHGNMGVSNKPIASFGYSASGAIIAYKNGNAILSHIREKDDAYPYAMDIMNCFGRGIKGMLVTGASVEEYEDVCNYFDIEVVGKLHYRVKEKRDIVVLPSTGELIVFGNEKKYLFFDQELNSLWKNHTRLWNVIGK